ESSSNSWIRRLISKLTKLVSPFDSLKEFYAWMGLHDYPVIMAEFGPNVIANMGELQKHSMGVTLTHDPQAQFMTFGCASCHSADLFGTKVLGMTNRFPRANETFRLGKEVLKV